MKFHQGIKLVGYFEMVDSLTRQPLIESMGDHLLSSITCGGRVTMVCNEGRLSLHQFGDTRLLGKPTFPGGVVETAEQILEII